MAPRGKLDRKWMACLVLACTVGLAPSAHAAGYGEPYLPDGARGLRGSVRWETLRQAAYTNANIFGAVGAYERYFRPVMDQVLRDEKDSFFVFAEEMYYTSHIASAPVFCQGVVYTACENTVAEIPFDQFSGGIALGGGSRHVGAFLATSWSLTAPSNDLYIGSAYTPVMPLITGWVLPFGKDAYASAFPGSIDGVLAGYVNVGPLSGSAGFVLSRGAFGDFSVPKLRAFLTSVITDEFSELGLFKSGFRDLDLLNVARDAKETASSLGTTAAYVRNLKLKPPNLGDPGDDPALSGQNFWTGHLEQWDIADILDVEAAYSFAPSPILHEAMVAVHTPYMPSRPRHLAKWGKNDDDVVASAYLAAGVVQLPTLWYYGVEGGRRFALSVELQGGTKRGGIKFFVRRNDPDFLVAFPYGQDALNVGFVAYLQSGVE